MSDVVKIAMESYSFGVSAALRDMGMAKEEALDYAVKEAAASGAKSLISRLGGKAKSFGSKAKDVASGAKSKAKDIAGKVDERVKKRPYAAASLAAGLGGAGGAAGYAAQKRDEK